MKRNESAVPTVDFVTSWGEARTLALFTDLYTEGGGLDLCALDATDPKGEGYLELWDVLSVNLPAASEWCATEGHVVLDASNVSRALVEVLVAGGTLTLPGPTARSGLCEYPLATVSP